MQDLNRIFSNIPIYWINLKDSKERFVKMTEQVKNYKNLRINAIDGRNKINFKKYQIKFKATIATNPVIAVICSHIKAIKTAYDNLEKMVVILEDDANFDLIKFYPHTINEIIQKTNNDWDIIQLYNGNTSLLNLILDDYKTNGLRVFKRDKNYSGTCYLINRIGMKKILNLIKTDGDKYFDLTKIIFRDPEDLIFNNLKSYILNCPFLYYYNQDTTVGLHNSNESMINIKKRIKIHQKSYLILKRFFKENFV